MLIKRIHGADVIFGVPPDWDKATMGECMGLPVRTVKTPEGTYMVSAWEPTPAEMQRMVDGEPLYLWIRGAVHPVVSVTVAGDPDVGI